MEELNIIKKLRADELELLCYTIRSKNADEVDNNEIIRLTDEGNFINRFIEFYKISLNELSSKSRKRYVVQLRMIFCYVLKNDYKMSYEKIGSIINRNHSSVTHYFKQHRNLTHNVYGDENYISKFELVEKIKLY